MVSHRCRRSPAVVLLTIVLLGGVLLSGIATAVPTTWVRVPSPNPSGQSTLNAVSCVSASFCMAVGDIGLFERWNGTRWSVIYGLLEADAGVSCATTRFCVAVGEHFPIGGDAQVVIDGWDGSKWSVVRSPTPGAIDRLNGVSCPSQSFCVAVGSYEHDPASAVRTLAEIWNGTRWSLASTPNSSTLDNHLNGVSCASSSFCVAVGTSHRSNTTFALIEQWNGTSWSIVSGAHVTAIERELFGVSCISPTFCAAVGYVVRGNMGMEKGLAETWDGTSWSSSTFTPGLLQSVSCVTSTSCVAVGIGAGGIQSWAGTGWSQTPVPPVGLSGVSCLTTTACTAVGFTYDSGGERPVVLAGS
jgi:hypothetical protein